MKIKIILICLGIVWFIILLLSINIFAREPVCGRVHLDEIDRSKDVIPTGEMAKRLVEIYENKFEKYNLEGGGRSDQKTKISYAKEVIYDERQYEWIVLFQAIIPEGCSVLDGTMILG